ncbi:MAG: hypothetical protein JJ892_01285 [Balneola sp.]|nr:hypothetical protein [Balneola sp.]MBO6650409.1 hypothetical protein [Balneola sp.]MBO6710195.1 hypothetical protein [Balneola sp.]MBO6798880.1 hypothetical protein [Balneola sp.]MBO6869994.1 hypothetical protein [Balneola sp.]
MIRNKVAYLFICFTAILPGCESLSLNDKVDEYPVIIERLNISDLEILNQKYHEKNNKQICSTLNEYGFTGYSRVLFPDNVNPCLNRNELKQEIPFNNDLLIQGKQILKENSEFTGVESTESLVLKDITSLNGCTICEGDINSVPLQWKFTFQPQVINDIEVMDSEILVYMDKNGVNRIWGNWFPVTDPGFVDFGSVAAKEKTLGMKVRYADSMNRVFEQHITENHISGEIELKFVAIQIDERLEVHKVWVFNILQENTEDVRWNIFISTVSGEVLKVKLL